MAELDLCFGYRPDTLGHSGICICGLYWTGHMPPHDSKGRLIAPYVLERHIKRQGQRLKTQLRREHEKEEFRRQQDELASRLLAGRFRA